MHLVSARAGSTHLRFATPWQARWHVTVLSTFAKAAADKPLRFSTGLAQPTFGRSGTMPPLAPSLDDQKSSALHNISLCFVQSPKLILCSLDDLFPEFRAQGGKIFAESEFPDQ